MAANLAGAPPPKGFEDSIKVASNSSMGADSLAGSASPQGLEDSIYGTPGQVALTGLEGAASGATLGLAPLAETKLLGVNPEEIKARQQANPGTNLLGNMAGGAGLIGLTGGLAAPAEEALLARGVGGLAAKAIGYGAEGAVFGAGNSLSDHALGDPNLNAQKVLSNIGIGALLGAGIGAATYGAKGLIGKSVSDVADKANASAETSEALSGEGNSQASNVGSGNRAVNNEPSLLTGLNQQKGNAQDIIKAGQEIGAPVTETMTSENKWLQRADDALINGAPTYSGIKRAKLYEQGYEAINKTLDGVLDTGEKFGGGPMTKAQLGDAVQGSLTAKISQESAPIENMFEKLKPHMEAIEVPASDTTSLSKEILDLPAAKTSFPDAKLAQNVAKDVLNIDSVDALKDYKSNLMKSISATASPGERHMLGTLADKLTELEEKSIVSAASDSALPVEVQSEMKNLLGDLKAARSQYKSFIEPLNTLAEQLGRKNAGGTQTLVNFIKDLDPEELSNKLFDKKYSSFNEFFAKKFPEESALMRQYQKQLLKDAASKSGIFSPKVFLNKIDRSVMQPEILESIFHPDEIKKINAVKTYLAALPKNFNPSGTSGANAFRSFFENPTGAVIANARDFGIEAFMKGLGSLPESARPNPYELGAEMADKFNKMSAIQKIANETDKEIAENAKSIFNVRDAIRGATIKGASLYSADSFDKASKTVKNLAENPAGIVDHIAHHTGDMNQSLPNVTQAIHTTSIAALSFLNSKLPRPANNLAMSHDYKPSPAEESKFMRYYNAVNNPVGVLEQVKKGTLSNEALEALHVVHPHLLQQMQKQVQTQLIGIKPDKIPYSIKMSVAKFLGQPLDSSMLPKVIQSNQISLSMPQQGNASAAPTGRRGGSMKALNLPARVRTQTQDDELDTK